MFFKIGALINFPILNKKISVLESLFKANFKKLFVSYPPDW